MLIVHGVEAWQPHPSLLVRAVAPRMDRIVGVSNFTLERFARWSHADRERLALLPNCVDLSRFTPGPAPAGLKHALGLDRRTVIMTLGRLAADERVKGFDEIIEALPDLARAVPDIAYLVCGDGDDRARLEAKAVELGVRERVVFAGYVPEADKLGFYRMADAFVMPSRGEGFGIVLLEALAAGLPVIGSAVDGSREALQEGALGALVDPRNARALVATIVATLRHRGPRVQPDLSRYSTDAFARRVAAIASDVIAPAATAGTEARAAA
jgi:glycosyltransferase involved in cell wall biosynthesis